MSYNGSGTFVVNSAGQPVVANTVISATVFNALTADLATGLSTCITKDGQTTVTANIPFGNNKITTLGAGTAASDAANLGQVQSTAAKLVTVTGTDTITGTMSPALTAYAAGQLFYFIANAANTGAVTINIDGLGAKSITRDGSTALTGGDINSGEVVVVVYDGTRFQMINAANSFGNTTINGTLTVTGNTALQANVSITSTLSVGGTFAVTGAATLGSTLAVTGKSDLPTVSTASINAAVALITTGTVTNLTASGASIASANIGNLQFTAASIASINAGVAVVTNLTATSASIASMNAGVALLTTATVTSLTATGASVASANVGTAVVTGLTVTGASIASVNAGTATLSGNLTLNGGTANGVLYLDGSKVATSGSALTYNGTAFSASASGAISGIFNRDTSSGATLQIQVVGNNVGTLGSDTGGNGRFDLAAASSMQLRATGAGSFMSFDANNAEQMRLTSTGLGIGTTSPAAKLHVAGESIILDRSVGDPFINFYTGGSTTNVLLYAGSSTGFRVFTSGTERLRLDSSGNLGLGVTPSAWDSTWRAFQIGGSSGHGGLVYTNAGGTTGQIGVGQNWYYNGSNNLYITSAAASDYYQFGGAHVWRTAASGTAGNAITFTQAMTLDASGNLGVGITSPGARLHVSPSANGIATGVRIDTNGATSEYLALDNIDSGVAAITAGSGGSGNRALAFYTAASGTETERARITSGGQFLVGTTTAFSVNSNTATGFQAQSDGSTIAYVSQNPAVYFGRQGNDGTIVSLRQDGVEEGTISVSGNTVSYNAFAGSHWSQLQDGSKPGILRGTVMESINELCVWPDEQNERLPKSKISDTVGSKKVYGVFMAWDNDWTTTNDMYVTAVGAFICRVNGSVTVQEGDLLESNGDGTARVQADDIIRSSTIGKVTSTVKTHQYDDGSYCVPTVLYCG